MVAASISVTMVPPGVGFRRGSYGSTYMSQLTVHSQAFSSLERLAAHAGVKHLTIVSFVAPPGSPCSVLDQLGARPGMSFAAPSIAVAGYAVPACSSFVVGA